MKNKNFTYILLFILILAAFNMCTDSDDDKQPKQTTKPVVATTQEPTPIPTEKPELSEEEYKNQCVELYYKDFFESEPTVGQYVKFYGFISGKYRYTYSSNFAIVIDDIIDKYDLSSYYMGSCVMHEETKNSVVPSYMGESVYLLFPNNHTLSMDNYKEGQKVIVYGEVVKTWNGIFIIPKYIE